MPKRQKLTYDNEELTRNLKQSAGKGVDALFSPQPTPLPVKKIRKQKKKPRTQTRKSERKKDSLIESKQDSTKAIKLSSYHDSMIEEIRKAVKVVGREVAFVRLTEEEKNQLSDAVYSYKRQKVKTSENEFIRIAVNFLLEDHKNNGKESLLDRVIAALNA